MFVYKWTFVCIQYNTLIDIIFIWNELFKMYICTYVWTYKHTHVFHTYLLTAPSVEKSRKQKKYAQTFATSACVNSLFGTCKEHAAQHKYFKALHAAALPSHILQDRSRQQAAGSWQLAILLLEMRLASHFAAVLCFFALFLLLLCSALTQTPLSHCVSILAAAAWPGPEQWSQFDDACLFLSSFVPRDDGPAIFLSVF